MRDIFENRWVTAAVCTWETVAIFSGGRVPSITRVHSKHPWFGTTLLGLLGWHLWKSRKEVDSVHA